MKQISLILEKIDRAIAFVSTVFGIIGAVWIGLLMLVITADVLGRLFFNSPITGTSEIVRNSVSAIVFLLIPYVMRARGHVRSTLVLARVPAAVRQTLLALSDLVGFALFALVAWSSWDPMVQGWIRGEFEGFEGFKLPVYPIRTVIVAASVLMCLECLSAFIKTLGGEHDESSGEAIE